MPNPKLDQSGCERCSRCCFYMLDGVKKKCKHLVLLPSGKSLCRIYKTRLGTMIDEGVVCSTRAEGSFDYEGCKLNSGKPILW